MEVVWKLVLLLLFLAAGTSTAAQEFHDYSSQLKHAVNSLNKLLNYMLLPRNVIGDMILGVVMARGECSGVRFISVLTVRTELDDVTEDYRGSLQPVQRNVQIVLSNRPRFHPDTYLLKIHDHVRL
jgi:hypothetical protein